ncbi:hypothetical protein N2152v2_004719 [Parachlorella kessleri]
MLLGRHFPQQYAERRRETLEEVEDLGLTPDEPVALPPTLAEEVCKQLDELLGQLWPGQQAQRAAEQLVELGDRGCSRQCPVWGSSLPTGLMLMVGQLLARVPARKGGPQSAVAQRLEENLRSLTGDKYVHHGVGCDVCGVYPIQGRRYRCRDCPESVGFDLCGSCWDKGVPPSVGRFNQRHTASHHMELVRPRAANPELPMEQLMWLLELAVGAGEEQQQQAGDQQQQQQQQQEARQQAADQQQQQQAEPEQREEPGASLAAQDHGQHPLGQGGGGESVVDVDEEQALPMPRWRGPRPAPDPTAQEPSPSAIPGQDEGPGAEEGGGAEVVFIPLETVAALLAGEEEENSMHVEE